MADDLKRIVTSYVPVEYTLLGSSRRHNLWALKVVIIVLGGVWKLVIHQYGLFEMATYVYSKILGFSASA